MICLPSDRRLKQCKILIIEDDRLNAELLMHCLRKDGYDYIMHATDGAEGMKIMRNVTPDIIILDIIMPNMNGFEFTQALRATARYEPIPIIFQTVLNNVDYKLRAFEMGATDYIAKPLDQLELLARVRVHLLNKILIEDLIAAQKTMQSELTAARHMQDKLLPNSEMVARCEKSYGLEIAHHFETSSILGGDCWGLKPLDEQRLLIFMFDLSGHGVSAAMNVFRLHTLMQDLAEYAHDPGSFLTTLSKTAHELFALHEFASMFYGIIDCAANCLHYATASSPPMLLMRTQEREPVILSGRGFPLGAVNHASYETHHVPFMQGDSLLLFSDCLIETANSNGEVLDELLIGHTVAGSLHGERPAHHALQALLNHFQTHSEHAPVQDDLTINLYHRLF